MYWQELFTFIFVFALEQYYIRVSPCKVLRTDIGCFRWSFVGLTHLNGRLQHSTPGRIDRNDSGGKSQGFPRTNASRAHAQYYCCRAWSVDFSRGIGGAQVGRKYWSTGRGAEQKLSPRIETKSLPRSDRLRTQQCDAFKVRQPVSYRTYDFLSTRYFYR